MEWKFKKAGHNILLTITDDEKILLQIDEEAPFECACLEHGNVMFGGKGKNLEINGKPQVVNGFDLKSIGLYDSIYSYRESQKKEKHDKIYNAIMNGEMPLDVYYKDGEHLWGYTSNGISAEVICDLHCGKYISGWGVHVDEAFADGDIEKMKAHYNKIEKEQKEKEQREKEQREKEKASYEAQKAKDLKDVEWSIKEKTVWDNGEEIEEYFHTITINNNTFKFIEKNVFDFGRDIALVDSKNKAMICDYINDRYTWMESGPKGGWIEFRELTPDELKAYMIICNYGKHKGSKIRM